MFVSKIRNAVNTFHFQSQYLVFVNNIMLQEKADLEPEKSIEMNLINMEAEVPEEKKERQVIGNTDQVSGLPNNISGEKDKSTRDIKDTFGLNTEDVETYKEAFNDFDHKHDGHISTQVIGKTRRTIGKQQYRRKFINVKFF